MASAAAALDRRQVSIIQDSFTRIAPKANELAVEFYERLFSAHPGFRSLFPKDMGPQREKLISTLAFVVRGLGDLSTIEKAVRDLGVRHRGYRVESAHYDAVGAALLATLAARLGPRWTPELNDAWSAAYGVLAKTMMEAAEARAAIKEK